MSTATTYPNWAYDMVTAGFFQQMSAIFADVVPTTPSGEEGTRSVDAFYFQDRLMQAITIGTIDMKERGDFYVAVLLPDSAEAYLQARPDDPAQIFCADIVWSFCCPLGGKKMKIADEELAQLPVVLLPVPAAGS